ncbi:MAG: nuclear transport factor 2 family protein [Abitibacteriaceae bacterium]|nr:nuclear transport factor 2 family protein [Abditibacteriaceae bacterium]
MSQRIDALAQRFIDALHTLEQGSGRDAEALAKLFSQDATLTNSTLEIRQQQVRGREQIMGFWVNYRSTLANAHSHFHHITLSDKAAGLFWTTTGAEVNGQPVNYHGATLLEFDDQGLISFFCGYYDTRELTVKAEADKDN